MSLGIEDNSHASIAAHIKQIGNPLEQGFALLHWTRIGGMAAVDGFTQELAEFTLAFKREKFEFVDWVQGKWNSYPSHGMETEPSLPKLAGILSAWEERLASIKASGIVGSGLALLARVVGY